MCVLSQSVCVSDKYFNNLKVKDHTNFEYSAYEGKY
jgi:hypothetical protein